MTDRALAAIVLAAGRGERLRPLTDVTPKPLLLVGETSLLDQALDRVARAVPLDPGTVAVNAHWLADQIAAHVDGRVLVSVEQPVALGTAGAIANLRDWLAGRDVLVANGDCWYAGDVDVEGFVAGWDGSRPRLLVVEDSRRADFESRWRFAGLSLLPSGLAAGLDVTPSGLFETVWSRVSVDLVPTEVTFIDCGTRADLDRARRLAAGGAGPAG